MSKQDIKQLSIAELRPNSSNLKVVAVVIAKRRVAKFAGKNGNRAVCGFTIRDTKFDFVNVTVWGTLEFVEGLSRQFNVGDIVQLVNPKIALRCESNSNAQFEPPVTSFVELTVNEESSQMMAHSTVPELAELIRVPTKPSSHYVSIGDIKSSGRQFEGQLTNLLVAVQWISPRRSVTTKKGESFVQDVEVMDRSSLGFVVSTWEPPIIAMIEKWSPRETCLFLADVRIQWNEFRAQLTGLLTSRSIVTVDPDTQEALELSRFASTAPIQRTAVVDALAESMANPYAINTVMSCDAVLERSTAAESSADSFTALVYAVVEVFDLDGPGVRIVRFKCQICGDWMRDVLCPNVDCQSHTAYGLVIATFDIRVTLVDHTHTLENCRLKGRVAEKILGASADDFAQLSTPAKIELKWKFLLKKVAARVVILPARGANRGAPLISIVALDRVSLAEFANGCHIR